MLYLGDCATYRRFRSQASRFFVWRNREKSRHDGISRVALRKKEEEKHSQLRTLSLLDTKCKNTKEGTDDRRRSKGFLSFLGDKLAGDDKKRNEKFLDEKSDGPASKWAHL
ncbi:hypothetical protein VNO80_26970 [Phaseolus coccineus]|uniref:Uncharacterized protein n=1 Tax=Phaseolus coccineus TaxID=3886 RepID=A0AAN9QH61_PHACN